MAATGLGTQAGMRNGRGMSAFMQRIVRAVDNRQAGVSGSEMSQHAAKHNSFPCIGNKKTRRNRHFSRMNLDSPA
jgi:hypothetical protein